ncbi:MAG: ribosome biogenesis GTPase Der [Eubacteriales bacterium]|nr:ribosome biogenesis GTPase Der [Eubacteriales bacterium]NCC81462.1 ribosome biogenesis GTPase Der [Clostridia bacterium]
MKPIVAIVGRPNVGKSTLFNRITGTRTAIIEDSPGVTRDRLYLDGEWSGKKFTLIDTGGIIVDSEDHILKRVREQAEFAINEADIILFVTDGQTGMTIEDEEVANILRKSQKPVVLAVNKIESYKKEDVVFDFYQLGLGDPIAISASQGMNTGDLLDAVVENFPVDLEEDLEPDIIKIAIVGRPNVGKSSLTNTLLGEERVIVSEIAGTTRDAIDSMLKVGDQEYRIIDTAGMRKRNKIDIATERYSVIRSLKAIDRSDIVLMMFDASEGITEQDKKIAGYVHESGKSCILVFNKWDLVEKDDKTLHNYEKKIRADLLFLQYAPIIFISAVTKQRVNKIIELIDFVAEQQNFRATTSALNEVIQDAVRTTPIPTKRGKRGKILYATQTNIKPPTFVFFVNDPELIHFSYERYLENKLREAFGFEGTPIWLKLKKREENNAGK